MGRLMKNRLCTENKADDRVVAKCWIDHPDSKCLDDAKKFCLDNDDCFGIAWNSGLGNKPVVSPQPMRMCTSLSSTIEQNWGWRMRMKFWKGI